MPAGRGSLDTDENLLGLDAVRMAVSALAQPTSSTAPTRRVLSTTLAASGRWILGLLCRAPLLVSPVMKHNTVLGVTLAVSMGVLVAACGTTACPAAKRPGVARFLERFEAQRRVLLAQREQANWVRSTFITHDTEQTVARAEEALMGFMSKAVKDARRYVGESLTADQARKISLITLSSTLAAPDDAEKRARLAKAATALQSAYGKGKWCPEGGQCKDLGQLSKIIATSRDPKVLRAAWEGWRTVGPPMRGNYREYVALANDGARGYGFKDAGAFWRSQYDMDPDAFAREVDRLFEQVKPLYEQLHCYVRARLRAEYGPDLVPATGPIPAQLLGNMWAQDWSYVAPLVVPGGASETVSPLTAALKRKGVDAEEMTRIAEGFFVSLGLRKLPKTFWTRSMFTKPRDRDVVCHASAWPVDWYDDLRIKMCIEVGEEDLVTLHHELGHLYYYDAYKDRSTLYADSAHDGFHEALGDVIALSVTPDYLKAIGLETDGLETEAGASDEEILLRRALERVAFLPFGVMIDQWRWKVFSGELPESRWNAGWWELKKKYQGVAPPSVRGETFFDPAAKYHVAAGVPYVRYFLAHILQFQLHRGLCRASGWKGPLHRCSIYGSKEAGARLQKMMAMGLSHPWPDALEAAIGERQMDGTALLEYFAPLMVWLKTQNAGQHCGW